ncbi:hypothetical protein E3J62_09575 [candidate division TA06 bacterium]|uniref:Uncharacterized protein n=1 Tax=candidate division TA06 bacterium TaxID=2250710 RepID=A0A523UQ93_UNCT6|nr:MAG: hypothetical protein E3J62_09575 [candidate division TA06 bacterium]
MVIRCPKCRKLLEVSKQKLGEKETCEHCNSVFVLDESVIYKQPADETVSIASDVKPVHDARTGEMRPVSARRVLLGVVVGIIVICVIGFVAAVFLSSDRIGASSKKAHPLVSRTFTLDAGAYWRVEFSSPDEARLVGSVSVPEWDVNVWLLEGKNNFEAFKNGERFHYRTDASGERVSNLDIDCTLGPTTYYFVVDNTHALLMAKKPTVNLTLFY